MKKIELLLPDECEALQIEFCDKNMDGFDMFVVITDTNERIVDLAT